MLKILKNDLILHTVASFGFGQIFFQVPPPIREPKILSPPPPIKNLEKKPWATQISMKYELTFIETALGSDFCTFWLILLTDNIQCNAKIYTAVPYIIEPCILYM